jgi:predicted AAA+ superfamily ATPase
MKIEKEELAAILAKFNPWWRGNKILELPSWKRAVFGELYRWITNPPALRATFISGARQVGKTTLIMQAIEKLIEDGVPPGNIFYTTFDHPLLKLAGIDTIIDLWRQREAKKEGLEYVFLDEAQFIPDWGTWVKHQTDFNKQRRIIFTGSATPILSNQESGVGRWHNIRLTTLSFYEYVRLTKITLPELPKINSLKEIFDWEQNEFDRVGEIGSSYIAHFHQYLLRGGFPQTAMVETINQAQKLLREDIVDKALKRDMTAMFGVRRILELEQTFLYLCMHDGAVLDMIKLCSNLGNIKRPTAQNFIELLEASHLIYKLQPFGYGTEILRGRHKIYLSDPAIAPAVMLKGQSIIDDPQALGISAESVALKHLFARYYRQNVRFSYWQNKKGLEVDLVAETGDEIIPFEVKYRSQHSSISDCKGLAEFCSKHQIKRGYIITKASDDFGVINSDTAKILKIPATLLCYFMGETEVNQS